MSNEKETPPLAVADARKAFADADAEFEARANEHAQALNRKNAAWKKRDAASHELNRALAQAKGGQA